MALEFAPELPQREQARNREDARFSERRIEDRRGVALREYKAIARKRVGIGRIELHCVKKRGGDEFCGRKARGGMARASGGSRAQRMDAQQPGFLADLPQRGGQQNSLWLGGHHGSSRKSVQLTNCTGRLWFLLREVLRSCPGAPCTASSEFVCLSRRISCGHRREFSEGGAQGGARCGYVFLKVAVDACGEEIVSVACSALARGTECST